MGVFIILASGVQHYNLMSEYTRLCLPPKSSFLLSPYIGSPLPICPTRSPFPSVTTYLLFTCLTLVLICFFLFHLISFMWHSTLKVHPCCCRWQYFIFFMTILLYILIYNAYIKHFIWRWVLRLFPYLDYYTQCCNKHKGIYISF